VDRRIFGVETEYGITCSFRGQQRLSPEEAARYLLRRAVSWGRSSNVFLRNGARLYLSGGGHPEYATPECDNVLDLVAHDKAGERILEGLLTDAGRRLRERGIDGDLYLFKNNTDSAGNSYGCHENYLVDRHGDFGRLTTILTPFLVTRQIICGAGKALQIQYEYLTRATDFTDTNGRDPVTGRVLEMWQRVLGAIETGNLDTIAREIDWVTKYQLIERYRARHDLPLSAPRIAQLDLAYHDLCRDRGLYYQLKRTGAIHRVTRDLDIFEAKSVPPQTTRARLRGEFIRHAQERRRDFAVDWVHLKLNDQAQRTVLCKDPFRSVDERVDSLIART
jgi:Pup-ligase protein